MSEHFKLLNICTLCKTYKKWSQKNKNYLIIATQKTMLRYSTKYVENAQQKKMLCTYTKKKIQTYLNISISPIFQHHTNKLRPNVESNSNGFL